MATAFYGTVSIKNTDGTVTVDRFDSTDIDVAYVTFKSSGGLAFFDVPKDGFIIDVVLNITAAGTTKDFKLWINQTDTNIRWVQSACFPTINNRFPNSSPIPVKRGQRIQMQALV